MEVRDQTVIRELQDLREIRENRRTAKLDRKDKRENRDGTEDLDIVAHRVKMDDLDQKEKGGHPDYPVRMEIWAFLERKETWV